MREPRLGDIIDDFCVRCKRIMNHAVVSVINNEPAKVRCRTCHSDHDYRHETAPPPKVDPRKAALFNEVLQKVNPGATAEPVAVPVAGPESEDEAVIAPPAPPVEAVVIEQTLAAAPPKPKAKKAAGRSKK
jgi:hypothetical protein